MLIMGQGAFYIVVNTRLLYMWVRTSSCIKYTLSNPGAWVHKPSVTNYASYTCTHLGDKIKCD